MTNSWRIVPLSEAPVSIIDGDRGAEYPKKAEFHPIGDWLFLDTGNVRKDGFDFSSCQFITNEKERKLRKGRLSRNDVVLTTRGTIGNVGLYGDRVHFDNIRINSGMVVLRANTDEMLPAFLFQVVRSEVFRSQVRALTSGAAQPQLPIRDIKLIRVPVPPLFIQARIASILEAYDDLMEVNRRRIALLEEMARRLFEEWFVRFRFPGREGRHMVETVEGPVPDGWTVARLGEVLLSLEAGTRPKGGIRAGDGEVASIGAENVNGLGNYDYGKEKLIPRSFFSTMRRGIVRSGDVLLYKDGAHVGRKAMFRDGYPYVECAVNEHVFILRPQLPITPSYLYFWLDQPRMTAKITGLNSNAAQPGLNQPGVSSLPIVQPPKSLVSRFTEIVEPSLGALFAAAKANHLLSLSRDLLLPRLVSGELPVDAGERELEEAAA